MSTSYVFDVAQICENGHLITKHFNTHPEERAEYCPQCSAKTISCCPSCGAAIRGCQHEILSFKNQALISYDDEERYHIETRTSCMTSDYTPPAYCYKCGKAYPWTQKLLDEANRIVNMSETLTEEEKKKLRSTFPDLICDNPNTRSATLIANKLMEKITGIGKIALVSLLKEHAVEIALQLFDMNK